MRESITGDSVFADNNMTRAYDKRPVLLVESDADQSILLQHIEDGNVRCAPGFSRTATLKAAELHLRANHEWVVGLVDRDCLEHEVPSNVVTTEYYDLEAELFFASRDRVSRYIVALLTSATNLKVTRAQAEDIMSAAVRAAYVIGSARLISRDEQLGLDLSRMPMHLIPVDSSLDAVIEAVAKIAFDRSAVQKDAVDLVGRMTAHLRDCTVDDLEKLCNGHDVFAGILSLVRKRSGQTVSRRSFDRTIHSVIDCEKFATLSFYDALNTWFSVIARNDLWDCNKVVA